MACFVCNVCGHVHDEAEKMIRWPDLPENWCCPVCASDKSVFIRR